jgi:hypothetical protein
MKSPPPLLRIQQPQKGCAALQRLFGLVTPICLRMSLRSSVCKLKELALPVGIITIRLFRRLSTIPLSDSQRGLGLAIDGVGSLSYWVGRVQSAHMPPALLLAKEPRVSANPDRKE